MRINLATHPPHAHFHWLLRDCTVKRHVTPVEQKTKVPIRSDSEYQCPTFAQYARNDNNSARLPTACDSKRKLKKKKGHALQSLPCKWALLVKLSQFVLFDAIEHKEKTSSIILPRAFTKVFPIPTKCPVLQ